MSYQATNLKKLKIAEITGSDLIIVTNVISSNGLPETKTIKLEELKNYSTSSSNINSTFRTGSYCINFYGTLTGSSDTSSYSVTSSISNYTDYLIYPNSSTSSVSIRSDYANNSLNSDYSISASVSDYSGLSVSASNIVLQNTSINKSDKSLFSESSTTSSLSEKTRYIPYSINNGTVYHSLHSDKCAYADVSSELEAPSSYIPSFGGDGVNSGNTTTMSVARTSSRSDHAEISLNSDATASYSKLSKLASRHPNGEIFAYTTFVISGSSGKISVDPKVWYNINSIKVSLIQTTGTRGLEISVNYQDPVPLGTSVTIKGNVSPLSAGYGPNWTFPDNLTDLVKNQLELNYLVNCWGSGCSSTSGKISVSIKNQFKTGKKRSLGNKIVGQCKEKYQNWQYVDVSPFLTNAIFSFVATIIPITDTSGSLELAPTTVTINC